MSTNDTAILPEFPGENFLSHAAAIFQEQVEARFAELGWLASAQGLQSEEVKAIVDFDLDQIPMLDETHREYHDHRVIIRLSPLHRRRGSRGATGGQRGTDVA